LPSDRRKNVDVHAAGNGDARVVGDRDRRDSRIRWRERSIGIHTVEKLIRLIDSSVSVPSLLTRSRTCTPPLIVKA
jgi:hypothetical protein